MRLQSGGGTRSPDDYEDVVGGKLQSSDGTHLFSPPGVFSYGPPKSTSATSIAHNA